MLEEMPGAHAATATALRLDQRARADVIAMLDIKPAERAHVAVAIAMHLQC